ncbi:MAG: OmpA family protein [Pseudomonadota bacterium]
MKTTIGFRGVSAAAVSVWIGLVSSATVAQTDCSIARDYDALAARAENDFLDEAALEYRARAVELCPDFGRWQAYGELALRFGDAALASGCLPASDGSEAICQSGNSTAAQAFVSALPLASDDGETAQAIGRYAQVLYQVNDPQKANNYISEALRLDPESTWIRDLANEIPRSMNTKEAMRSGLGDFKVPEMVLASLSRPASNISGAGNHSLPGADRVAHSTDAARFRTNAINIPLNFFVSSTRLDETSRRRLKDVVEILAEDSERRYHLIGHADVTGDSTSNQTLSEERAYTVFSMLVTMEPSLDKRISHEGVGSSRPLRSEMTAEAHRVNRRVEIFVR